MGENRGNIFISRALVGFGRPSNSILLRAGSASVGNLSPDALLASINLALCKLQNSFLTKTKVKYLQSLTARFGFRFVFRCCADHAPNQKFQKRSFVKFLLFTARVILDSQRLRVRLQDRV